MGGGLYNRSIIRRSVGNIRCSSLCTVLHQYSQSNCCSERKRPENWLCDKRKKRKIFRLVCALSHLASFFLLVSALLFLSIFLFCLFSVLHVPHAYSVHHTHQHSVYSPPPFSALSKTSPPSPPVHLLFFLCYLNFYYFWVLASLPPALPAAIPPCFSLVFSHSPPIAAQPDVWL